MGEGIFFLCRVDGREKESERDRERECVCLCIGVCVWGGGVKFRVDLTI